MSIINNGTNFSGFIQHRESTNSEFLKPMALNINIFFQASKIAIKNAFIPDDDREQKVRILETKEREVQRLTIEIQELETKLGAVGQEMGSNFVETLQKTRDAIENPFGPNLDLHQKIDLTMQCYRTACYNNFRKEILEIKINSKISFLNDLNNEIHRIKNDELLGIIDDEKNLTFLREEKEKML